MSFPNTISGAYGFEKETTSSQKARLGTEMAFPDGRKYRYVENGGTAIEEGMVVASEAPAGNHSQDLAVATTSSGSLTVAVTLGATAAAKNLYAEGYLFMNTPTGGGGTPTAGTRHMYKIKSHEYNAGSAAVTINIEEPEGLRATITNGTEKAGLIKNPFKDIVVAPAAIAGRFIGLSVGQIAANYFGWVQVAGMAVAAIDGTPAFGTLVGASGTHAGSLVAVGADTTVALARVHGQNTTNDEYHTVFLMNLY